MPDSIEGAFRMTSLATTARRFAVVVALATAIVGLLGSVPSSVAATDPEQPKEYFDEAKEFLAKGDVQAAIIQLKNAIKSDPDNVTARMMLGEIYLDAGVGDAAEKEFQAAIRRGYQEPVALVRLGRAYLLQGKLREVIDEVPVDQADPKLEAEALVLRGTAYLGLGQDAEAETALREAEVLDSTNVTVPLSMAQIHVTRRDLVNAEASVDKALSMQPDLVEAQIAKGELRRLAKDLDGAVTYFSMAIATQPRSSRALLGRAAALIDQGKLDEAKADVSVILADVPSQPLANFLLAMIRAKQNDLPGARDAINAGGPALDEYLPAQFLSGAIDYAQGHLEQAVERLERYVTAVPGNLQAQKLLAATQLRRNAHDQAIEILEPLLVQRPDDVQILTLLGNAYVKTGKFTEASELFERAVTLSPDAASLRMQLAMSQVAGGDLEAAAGQLSTVVDLDPDQSQAHILLVLLKLREQKFDEALTAIEDLRKRVPDNPLADNLAGAALLGKGDVAGARANFDAALVRQPEFVPAMLNLAQIDIKEGKPADARKRFEKVLELEPKRQEARTSLASLVAGDGDLASAERILAAGIEADPEAPTPRLTLAEFFLKQGATDKALAVLRDAVLEFPDDPQVHRALGITHRTAGNHQDAVTEFQQLVELTPGSAASLFALVQSLVSADRLIEAQGSLDRALAIEPQNLELRVAAAELAIRDKRYAVATDIATALRDEFPDKAFGYMLLGSLHADQGSFGDAAANFAEALARENNAQIAVRLFEVRRAGGEADKGLAELEAWDKANPGFDSIGYVLAGAYIDAKRYEESIKLYEDLGARGELGPAALNNLAWLYQKIGDPRSLETAEKALALASEQPAIIDTVGWILVERGDTQRGLEHLEKAVNLAPANAEIRYHLAVALAKDGQNEQSCRELGDIFDMGGSFAGIEDARQLSKDLSCG